MTKDPDRITIGERVAPTTKKGKPLPIQAKRCLHKGCTI